VRCRIARKRLSCWIDEELPEREARVLEAHLASCGSCREVLTGFRLVRKAFTDRAQASPLLQFYSRVAARLESETLEAGEVSDWRYLGRYAVAATLLIAIFGLSLHWVDRQLARPANGIIARYLEAASGEDPPEIAVLYRAEVSREAILELAIREK
jgi:anti-sigma factor RsiW